MQGFLVWNSQIAKSISCHITRGMGHMGSWGSTEPTLSRFLLIIIHPPSTNTRSGANAMVPVSGLTTYSGDSESRNGPSLVENRALVPDAKPVQYRLCAGTLFSVILSSPLVLVPKPVVKAVIQYRTIVSACTNSWSHDAGREGGGGGAGATRFVPGWCYQLKEATRHGQGCPGTSSFSTGWYHQPLLNVRANFSFSFFFKVPCFFVFVFSFVLLHYSFICYISTRSNSSYVFSYCICMLVPA